jgi:hypothetical protein
MRIIFYSFFSFNNGFPGVMQQRFLAGVPVILIKTHFVETQIEHSQIRKACGIFRIELHSLHDEFAGGGCFQIKGFINSFSEIRMKVVILQLGGIRRASGKRDEKN